MKGISFAVAAVFAMLLPGVAAAGPRDVVVQGIVRCGGLADDRQWLDCVYGAAQPMRAQLGLPPAPLAQQRLVPAQGYGTLPGYGGISAPLSPAIATAPQPAGGPAPRPMYTQAARSDKGFLAHLVGEKDVPDIVSPMARYSFSRDGQFTVTLANGQTWIQVGSDGKHAGWSHPAARYVATISSGAFGTYNLTVMNEPGAFKVKRVK